MIISMHSVIYSYCCAIADTYSLMKCTNLMEVGLVSVSSVHVSASFSCAPQSYLHVCLEVLHASF